jgi:hypothetical protein
MNSLLTLEPREASAEEVEPNLEFEAGFDNTQDRTRCAGCCVDGSWSDIATHSYTQ